MAVKQLCTLITVVVVVVVAAVVVVVCVFSCIFLHILLISLPLSLITIIRTYKIVPGNNIACFNIITPPVCCI